MKNFTHTLVKLLLAGALVLLTAPALHAQQKRVVTGSVTDKEGTPLVGVTVLVKGTAVGTTTQSDGRYELEIPADGEVLQFSFLGMDTQETAVGSRTTVDMTLSSSSMGIDEVVVVGYGTLTKRELSSSVGSLRSDDLDNRTSAFNIMQDMAGKIAGVKNVSFSGKPGGASALRIRGMGSINAGSDPIYVLDGVVGVNPQLINPANVESIDVLKDAAATSMYGAQGANGVVIITTKSGRKGEGTVTYNGKVGVGFLNRKVDLLNADEFMEVQRRAYAYSGKVMPHLVTPMENLFWYAKDASGNYKRDDQGNLIASPRYDTDWQEALTQNAVTNDHTVSFTSAGEKTSVYSSIAYQDFQGLVRYTYSNRLSGTVNVRTDVNRWLNVQTVVTAATDKSNDMEGGFGQGPIRNMLEMPPIVPVKYDDGTWGRKNDYPLGEVAENPIRLLRDQKKIAENDYAIFNMIANLKLTKKLTLTLKGDYSMTNHRDLSYAKAGLLDVSENNGGFADIYNTKSRRWSNEDYLTYTDKFFGGRLSSTFVLGASWYYNHSESSSSGSEDFFDDSFGYHNLGAGTTYHQPASGMEQNTMNSYYFRMNHSFLDRYLLGFTFRADGASNFGANNKYGYFPSASAAWIVSEEPFFAAARKVVNNMKLRVSYGAVGNASIPNYRTISQYSNGSMILNGELNPYVVLSNLGNEDLKWETSKQFNAGLDLGLYDNRLQLIFEYYNKTTTDLLFQKQVPYTTGYATTWTNLGKIRNRGFEVTVSSRNIEHKDFQWTTDIVFSTNKLLVLDVGGETIDTGNNTIARAGEEWASYFVLNRIGTWGLDEVDEARRYGKKPGDIKYEDVDHNYKIDDADRKIMGNGTPKGDITMVNTFRWRGLSLMVDLNACYGFKILGIAPTMMENRQLYGNSLKSVLNAWTPENPNSMIAALRLPSDTNFGENEKDSRMLYKGDFLRIRNISLSYDFSPELLRKSRVIKGLSIGINVENLHVFTSYPGFDPEVGAFNTDTGQSIDFYSYPRPTTVSANIKITF
ncbi:SusC/RagA family TonB-linked outer membrane protein [uncultured Alistipes sp.]|uniref:SusC/RagA family TonB-linked outer membrane protein n=1 Tax=uncultured Alistipes sp. TaxID=538949 RepID=UPI00263845DD|nr:SusC/RagA family TonB-linked outer membrane protein [uncultured Alistipes sp.]